MSAPVDPVTDLPRLLARINVLCAEIRKTGRRLRAEGRLHVKNTKAGARVDATGGEK